MSTGDRNTLNLPGQQAKDNTPDETNRVRMAALRGYLRGLPSLDFSKKGRTNICTRFGLNEDELSTAVASLQTRPGRPTAALLRIIGAAVNGSPDQKGEKGAGQC